jgi:hypothetical protein
MLPQLAPALSRASHELMKLPRHLLAEAATEWTVNIEGDILMG